MQTHVYRVVVQFAAAVIIDKNLQKGSLCAHPRHYHNLTKASILQQEVKLEMAAVLRSCNELLFHICHVHDPLFFLYGIVLSNSATLLSILVFCPTLLETRTLMC